MSSHHIHELTTRSEFEDAYPVLSQLRDHLSLDEYLDSLATQRDQGYRLFALSEDDEIVAVAGIAMRHNFYNADHVFVYDLVTDESHRGEGYGTALLEFVHELARDAECGFVTLESGLWREEAHEFYESRGYEKFCYSFRKDLD